ncbi:hypothetical protein BpHYR1_023708 [Brachionus plicatilis]|uniref:Uncharacterized protein n=1 Tax=Brachionus plicatilis TaxID=10195 RepID=A0A3M7RTV3_BRAPC|nr:hypothetical protein BpHYR1_023708 [Brachionus plicatilis]
MYKVYDIILFAYEVHYLTIFLSNNEFISSIWKKSFKVNRTNFKALERFIARQIIAMSYLQNLNLNSQFIDTIKGKLKFIHYLDT